MNKAEKRVADKPWLSGEPFYCAVCGLGLGEYYACEEPNCELESREEAQKRRAIALAEAQS